MTYAEAIEIAANICGLHNRDDVATVLRDLPQMHIAANAVRIDKKLAAAGMSLQGVIKELREANESGDNAKQIRAAARLEIAVGIMEQD
jgi:hypothetical protein